MLKRYAAILALVLALPGCGGGDDEKMPVGAATLKQTGVVWRKLTPLEKKTVVAYCLPPRTVDVSPTRVAGEINRLYARESASGRRIGVACTQAVNRLRAGAPKPDKKAEKRVARASKALLELCPDDLQFVEPGAVEKLVKRLALAYERSPDPAKDRKDVEEAIAELEAGCGPSARLQRALRETPRRKTTQADKPKGARTFAGNGPRELGNLAIPTDSDLRWARGGKESYFSVTGNPGRHLSFLSEAPRGYRGLPAGTYRDVRVDTDGSWTLTITPKYPSPTGS